VLRIAALVIAVLGLVSCASNDSPAPDGGDDARLTDEQRAAVEELQAIGYLAGTRTATAAGVTIHERGRAADGLNLFTSGHAPEATLMDMDGRVLHRWRREFREIWPDAPEPERKPDAGWWRRCRLLPDGTLLAIFEGLGIVKLDRGSTPIWAALNGAHHDLDILPDGRIWLLTRRAHIVPWYDAERPVLEDFVTLLDPEGRELRRISLLQAFEESEFRDVWRDSAARRGPRGDVFHTNSLEILDGRLADRDPAFREGNLLLSMLKQSVVAILDPEIASIVWTARGEFRRQHDPGASANGGLLLFDNLGLGDRSRILELDPVSLDTIWSYEGSERYPFFSEKLGTAQRLPNGNTLITESDNGRAFEVTTDGEIVWEFYNPHRTGEDGELVATLPELRRLPPEPLNPLFERMPRSDR
jgi:hypothetical protein